ncbi:MAG TPA: ABC transporter substrate-binding protein [Acidimicrobiia bacterium]
MIALLAAACSGGTSSSTTSVGGGSSTTADTGGTTTSAGNTGEPKYGGVLKFQLLRDADAGYDPNLATLSTVYTITQLIFDTLGEVTPDGEIVPSLATDWEISDDELTYTFHLRDDVLFHNGRQMTSADVKYTIERIKNPETNSPRRAVYEVVESIETPDDTTVVFHLSEPYAPFLAALSDITAAIVPQEVVEAEGGTLNTNPVGTGPFKFVEWQVDRHVIVERNDDYWREGLPYLDGIEFSFNDDGNARAANVRSGTIDFLWNATPELVSVLREDPNLVTYGGEGTQSFQYLLLNINREPFDDVRVRQAIFWALDREAIRMVSRPDTTTPLNSGFLPATHWAGVQPEDFIYTQDYDRARSLLEEAGVGNGFDMEILVLVGSDFHIRTAQVIQSQLEPLGINVTVTTVESGQQTERRNNGDFDGIVTGFSGTIDPDERVTQTFVTGGGTNYVHFSDEIVDQLAEEARRTSDRERRGDLYRQLQLRVAEVGPMAFIYNYHFVDALRADVKGYTFNPQLVDYRSVREVWLDR